MMTARELISLLNEMPDLEVMIDHTTEEGTMFKFVEVCSVSEVDTAIGETLIVLSPQKYLEDENIK
jgi:hypothetical protein